jgi:Flp pilus assembly pilin Flp
MIRAGAGAAGFLRDQAGQATLEWMLLLVVFGLPMVFVFATLMNVLCEHYRMVTFFQTLPFP